MVSVEYSSFEIWWFTHFVVWTWKSIFFTPVMEVLIWMTFEMVWHYWNLKSHSLFWTDESWHGSYYDWLRNVTCGCDKERNKMWLVTMCPDHPHCVTNDHYQSSCGIGSLMYNHLCLVLIWRVLPPWGIKICHFSILSTLSHTTSLATTNLW